MAIISSKKQPPEPNKEVKQPQKSAKVPAAENLLQSEAAINEQGKPEGLLKGRAFEMHITHGTLEAYATVMRDTMKTRLEKGIFGFCDSKVDIIFYDLANK